MIRFQNITLGMFAAMLMTGQAWALDLQQARHDKLVGEMPDGFVSVVKASPEVTALVEDINRKRRQEYARISGENGESLEVIGKLAAPKIIANLPGGSLYRTSKSGDWQSK